MVCCIDGCGNSAAVRGWCNAHYLRWRRYGDPLGTGKVGTHGLHKTPEYRAWVNMKSRCTNPRTPNFHVYGGRGIKVCDRWLESFENFNADVGPRPTPKHSLDRWPNQNGDYEPSNVRWATRIEQMRNVTVNRLVHVDGKEMTLADAVEATDIKYNTILYRLKRGWTLEDALVAKPHKGVRSCRV